MQLVLASQSPRRIGLLKQIGLNPLVHPADIDESTIANEAANDYVRRMAESKARAISHPGAYVLAADTSVIIDGLILGKPSDIDDFKSMMARLSGREHQVLSAVAVQAPNGVVHTTVEATTVRFIELDPAAVSRYWHSGEPQDKAGGYGIQGLVSHWVENLQGCYFNVVGLPLAATVALLKQAGYKDSTLL